MPTRTMTVAGRNLTLDARPDRLDIRDYPYRPPVFSLDPVYPTNEQITELLPKYREAGLVLNQGQEGACTGFGLAAVINFLLWRRSNFTMPQDQQVSPRMLYHLARLYDEWDGEDYEGSSCRGALKGWQRHGVCLETTWPYRKEFVRPKDGWDSEALSRPLGVYYRINRQSVVDIQAAIAQTGAVYVSAVVHAGWDVAAQDKKSTRAKKLTHKMLPVIAPSKEAPGGHAFALVGYNDVGFIVQNSWGEKWGAGGFAILPYADWVENGTDAWVVALGVPVASPVQGQAQLHAATARQHFMSGGQQGSTSGAARMGAGRSPSTVPQPLWSEQDAYWHTLVTGNDGYLLHRLPQVENEEDNAAWVCHEQPKQWFETQPAGTDRWRLAIYAHGGLNSESVSIERIRVLGPCFTDNGIYPIFTTWKSGWLETLGDMLADGVNKFFGGQLPPTRGFWGDVRDALTNASDRALEITLRNTLGKSLWSEMKENVERSSEAKRGLDLLADQLRRLDDEAQGKLDIHLIGHSAGSFVCGRLLSELRQRQLKVKTCTLYAPACDIQFALKHFRVAIEKNQLARTDFRVHLLSDRRELEDTVGPYRKSLLYLVSRALERLHQMPLLGLVSAFDHKRNDKEYWHEDTLKQVKEWQNFFWNGAVPSDFATNGSPAPGRNLFILSDAQVDVGPRRLQSSHGCFDNSIAIITSTLQTILGGDLPKSITNLDY